VGVVSEGKDHTGEEPGTLVKRNIRAAGEDFMAKAPCREKTGKIKGVAHKRKAGRKERFFVTCEKTGTRGTEEKGVGVVITDKNAGH